MTEWPTEPLRDLGVWSGGGTPSKSRSDFWEDGDVPWLSPKDMGPETLVDTRDRITKSAVADSAVRLLGANAIAVVVRSGILERTIPVALVPFATTLNQDMKALECRPGIDPRWVAWGLRASERELLRTARKAGTTVASIEWPRFLNWRLPIPDHAEQRRIVDILEDHLSRLKAGNDYLDAAAARASAAVRSSAAAAVHAAEKSIGTRVVELGQVARIGSGTTPRRGDPRYWLDGSVPWVTSGELAQGVVTATAQHVSQFALADTALKLWPEGTLLVAMYGEGRTRGTVGELAIAATTNQACAAILLDENSPTSRAWLRLVLEARRDSMRRSSSGGVQPNLNLGFFKAMQVPWPSAEKMARLIAAHDDLTKRCEVAVHAIKTAERRVGSLRRSLLTAAFSGRLTGRESDLDFAEELASA